MSSKALLSSVAITLLFCTKSIASNGYFIDDSISKIIWDAESSAAQEKSSPWMFIGTSTVGSNFYLNTNSIRKENTEYEKYRSSYVILDSQRPYKSAWWKAVDTNGDYLQIQTNFYCYKGFITHIASVRYDANHNYLGDNYLDKKLDPVIPDSVFSKIFEVVCNGL